MAISVLSSLTKHIGKRQSLQGRDQSVKGFLIGGLAWFAIPFALATTLGLAAVAIDVSLTPKQIESGLVAPANAPLILGDAGAILLLSCYSLP